MFNKKDVVLGKVSCNIRKGCFVECENGMVFLPNYQFKEGTKLFATIIKVPSLEEVGKYPVVILDSVCYQDEYLVA